VAEFPSSIYNIKWDTLLNDSGLKDLDQRLGLVDDNWEPDGSILSTLANVKARTDDAAVCSAVLSKPPSDVLCLYDFVPELAQSHPPARGIDTVPYGAEAWPEFAGAAAREAEGKLAEEAGPRVVTADDAPDLAAAEYLSEYVAKWRAATVYDADARLAAYRLVHVARADRLTLPTETALSTSTESLPSSAFSSKASSVANHERVSEPMPVPKHKPLVAAPTPPAPAPDHQGRVLPKAATAPFWTNDNIVGCPISVLWNKKNSKFYDGKVGDYNAETGTHEVIFDDGDTRYYILSKKTFKVEFGGPGVWREYERLQSTMTATPPLISAHHAGVQDSALPSAAKRPRDGTAGHCIAEEVDVSGAQAAAARAVKLPRQDTVSDAQLETLAATPLISAHCAGVQDSALPSAAKRHCVAEGVDVSGAQAAAARAVKLPRQDTVSDAQLETLAATAPKAAPFPGYLSSSFSSSSFSSASATADDALRRALEERVRVAEADAASLRETIAAMHTAAENARDAYADAKKNIRLLNAQIAMWAKAMPGAIGAADAVVELIEQARMLTDAVRRYAPTIAAADNAEAQAMARYGGSAAMSPRPSLLKHEEDTAQALAALDKFSMTRRGVPVAGATMLSQLLGAIAQQVGPAGIPATLTRIGISTGTLGSSHETITSMVQAARPSALQGRLTPSCSQGREVRVRPPSAVGVGRATQCSRQLPAAQREGNGSGTSSGDSHDKTEADHDDVVFIKTQGTPREGSAIAAAAANVPVANEQVPLVPQIAPDGGRLLTNGLHSASVKDAELGFLAMASSFASPSFEAMSQEAVHLRQPPAALAPASAPVPAGVIVSKEGRVRCQL